MISYSNAIYRRSTNIANLVSSYSELRLLAQVGKYCVKHIISTCVVVLVAFGPIAAQSIEWQWGAQSTSTAESNKQILGSQLDAQGNSYIVGWFSGAIDFGRNHLISQGRSDLFVAKLTPNGTWAWALAAGSKDSDRATAVVLDAKGNLYIAGNFAGDIRLGKSSFTSQGELHSFVAQISKNGHWNWATGLSGTNRNEATSLALSGQDLIVTGRFENVVSAGSHKLQSKGQLDGYIASVSRKGVWNWATSLGGMSSDAVSAVTTSKAGEIYATGYSCGTSIDAPVLAKEELVQLFVVKLDARGKRQWLTEAIGNSTGYGKAIARNADGQLVITGSISGQVSFDSTSLTSRGGDDAFVAQLNEQGRWQWVAVLGDQLFDTGAAVTINALGNACVAGTFQGFITGEDHSLDLKSNGQTDIFVAQFTAQGKMVGSVAIGSEAAEEASGLLVDATGKYYLSGLFSRDFKLGFTSLKATSPQAFMARMVPTPYVEKKVVRQ